MYYLQPDQAVFETSIPGGWSVRDIQINGRVHRWRQPHSPDEFVYSVDSGKIPDSDVYWAQVWTAAEKMLPLVPRLQLQPESEVLELGCGLGLIGFAAALEGARVTLSDYEPIAVQAAISNAQANGLSNVRGLVLDWREEKQDLKYDVIVASDILYYAQFHEPLLRTLLELATATAEIWIGDAGREPAFRFLESAKRNFRITLYDQAMQAGAATKLGTFFLAHLKLL